MRKYIIGLLLVLPLCAHALTAQQMTTLKAAAVADQTASACLAAGDDGCVSTWFNTASTFIVWKSSTTQDEILQSAAFDWTRVDNLTTGKARIWAMMFDNSAKSINAANANVRAGIDATWVGTAADLAVRASVYAMCKRFATQAEKALAAGTGADVSPGTLTFEGQITVQDVTQIRTLP